MGVGRQKRQKVSLGKMADHHQDGGGMGGLMTRGPAGCCPPWIASVIPVK